jgi:cytochrome c peroxidase
MRRCFFQDKARRKKIRKKYRIEEQHSIEEKYQVRILKTFMIKNISDPRERFLKAPLRYFFYCLPLVVILFFAYAFKSGNSGSSDPFKEFMTDRSISLITLAREMKAMSEDKKAVQNSERMKEKLRNLRNTYKEIEAFVVHFFPGDAFAVNMMDLSYPEEEDEIAMIFEPHGMQVLERLIYTDSSLNGKRMIRAEIESILDVILKWPGSIQNTEFPQREIFEAAQLGMIKSFLFGLTNIETPNSENAFNESLSFLNGLEVVFSEMYANDSMWTTVLQPEFFSASEKLRSVLLREDQKEHPDYFTIYKNYYIPFSEILGKVRHFLVRNDFFQTAAVNLELRSIFDPGAFNSYFFLSGKKLMKPGEVAELGKILFFDPALSMNSRRACASCHIPSLAFSDGLALSRAFHAGSTLSRNAPGLLNSVLQRRLFLDGRTFSFENQASEVLNNPEEMHSDFSSVADLLQQSAEYREMFRSAYENTEDTVISSRSILMAIAEYERNLIALNSPFDKAIRGQEDLLSHDEKAGFNLFMGKANCASCHFIPLFNGTVPPAYVATELEAIGVPGNADLDNPLKDLDPGRESVIPMEFYRGKFKTTSIRNVDLTAPYMHNGVFQTLEEVVEFYNRGGGAGIGLDIPNQTLAPDSLQLTDVEKRQLVAFMKTLTDTVNTTHVPARLPLFENNASLNGRIAGGEY